MSNIAGNVLLNNVRGYSGTQRAGFTGIFVGFIMCCVGCFVPYWKTGSISIETPIPGLAVKMIEVRQGLWLFCSKVIGMEEKCVSTYKMNDAFAEVHKALHIEDNSMEGLMMLYIGSLLCLGLALITGLAACCRFCCCSGGKTMCHGFLTFCAGASGITVSAVFVMKGNDILGITFVNDSEDYGWAFFVFIIGSSILTISSFMLCFSSPRANAYHIMPANNASCIVVQTSNTSQTNMMSAAVPAQEQEHDNREMQKVYYHPDSNQFAA